MECTVGRDAGYSCTVHRNNSLSTSDRLFAYGFIAFVSLLIAVAFAWLGAWMILPFAGVEVALLAFAFCYVERHAHDFERVTIEGDTLRVEVCEGGRERRFELNRWWAQVSCTRDGNRLALRSHGKEIVFGQHLTNAQRLAVAHALKSQLHGR
jgi:uncharacterized membrane protein